MARILLMVLWMNASVVAAATDGTGASVTNEAAKPSDCDSSREKVAEVLTVPKTDEAKALEEKALANLGLIKQETKKPALAPVVASARAMETCK